MAAASTVVTAGATATVTPTPLSTAAVLGPPRPAADEAPRLAALERYGLSDGEWGGSVRGLEAATRLAARITGVAHAGIHIITASEQVRIAATGASPDRMPREHTFCNRIMYSDQPAVVLPDLTRSAFASHPHVNGELASVRYYAAVPLLADDGQPLGTVCAWSEDSGRADGDVQQGLVDLGTLIADELEARRLAVAATRAANFDPLTQLPNRRSADERLVADLADIATGRRSADSLVVLLIDLVGFKSVNDTFGHAAGDALLTDAARRLRAAVRDGDMVSRWGGDEFLVIADTNAHPDAPDLLISRIHDELARAQAKPDRRARGANAIALRGSVGAATAWIGASPQELVHAADVAMYATRADRTADHRSHH